MPSGAHDSLRAPRFVEIAAVQDERDRTVVDQLNLHVRPEASACDADAVRLQRRRVCLDQRLGDLRAGVVVEAGASALAHVTVERELADDERLVAALQQ